MIIELPNGQELEFPDNTPPEVMRAAIARQFPEFANQKKTGWSGVAADIGKGVAGIPHALLGMLTELPGQAASSVGQIATNPGRATANLGAGFLEGLKGLANVPSNVASYLGSRDIGNGDIQEFIKGLHIGDTGLEKSLFGETESGDELLRGLGSFAGGGGALGAAQKGLRGLGARLGGNALYAVGQEQNPVEAMLLGLGGEGLAKGLQKAGAAHPFTPSSPLTNEQLKKNVELTRGTETGLGDVLENPFLKKTLENRLPDIPFSGAQQAMQRTAEDLTSRGNQIMRQLGLTAENNNINQSLQQALKEGEQEALKIKTKKFDALNKAAEELGVGTQGENLRRVSQKKLAQINKDPRLAYLMENQVKGMLNEFSKLPKSEKFHENLLTKPDASLRSTDLLRGELGELAYDAYVKGDNKLSSIYTELKRAAEKDIHHSIEKSGNRELKNLRNDAFDFYKNEWVPFEDKDIRKFTRQGGDTDTLVSHFLRKSPQNDRANLLNKLTSKLTPDQRDLVAHRYFSEALQDGELNPMKFKTLYKKLGEKQKETLLGKEQVKKLNNYVDLVQKNTEPLTMMFNPKTGARNTGALPWLTAAGGIGASVLTGNPLHALGVVGAPIIAGRPLTKYLTNEARREKIVNDIIRQRMKRGEAPKNLAPYINAILQSSQTYPQEGEY